MLLDILTDLALEIGQTNDDSDRSARIYRINKAAKEIQDSVDLREAMEEKVFDFSVDDSQQISLPAYVDKVRGMRYHDSRHYINIDDMMNRYNFSFNGENELWYLTWRELGVRALSRNIDNESVLIASIPIATGFDWTLTITGTTDNAYRTSETLTFGTADIEKQTTLNFVSVESIVKNRIIPYDVTIKDVEENELAVILNSEYQSYYRVFQIEDTENFSTPENASGIEVRYKKKFQPFKNDADCFLGTDIYDPAIVWKFLEHRSKDLEESAMYALKCRSVISQLYTNEQAGKRTKINFKPQQFFNLPYGESAKTRYL